MVKEWFADKLKLNLKNNSFKLEEAHQQMFEDANDRVRTLVVKVSRQLAK